MGQEILYCYKCGKKLIGEDFTRGRAHTFNNRQYCSACVPQSIRSGAQAALKEPRPAERRLAARQAHQTLHRARDAGPCGAQRECDPGRRPGRRRRRGSVVDNLYFLQRDRDAVVTVHEIVIFKAKD